MLQYFLRLKQNKNEIRLNYEAMRAGKYEKTKGSRGLKSDSDLFVIIRIQMTGTFKLNMPVERINRTLSK